MAQVTIDINSISDLENFSERCLSAEAQNNLYKFCTEFRGYVDDVLEYVGAYYNTQAVSIGDLEDFFSDESKFNEIRDFFEKEGDLYKENWV